MHDEKILQPLKRHAATVVTYADCSTLTVKPHVNGRTRSRIYVLQPVCHVFPDYEFVSLEKTSILQQIPANMALNEDVL